MLLSISGCFFGFYLSANYNDFFQFFMAVLSRWLLVSIKSFTALLVLIPLIISFLQYWLTPTFPQSLRFLITFPRNNRDRPLETFN